MSFIAEYESYTSGANTDPLWKTWTAITILSAACGRKVFAKSGGQTTFTNLYVLFVGEPAAGKSEAMRYGRRVLSELKDVHFAADDSNAAVTISELADQNNTVTWIDEKGITRTYNSLLVYNSEFGTFLPEYERKMMNILQALFDNEPFRKKTIARGEESVNEHWFGILGACTPGYLQSTIPEGAWNEGFMGRTIMVYGKAQPPTLITESENLDLPRNFNTMMAELRLIAKRRGHIRWHSTGIEAMNNWILSGLKPAPTHPRLLYYNGRRRAIGIKLALIYALDDQADRINSEHVKRALDVLFETEERMPEVFKSMRAGGDQQVMKELLHFMVNLYVKRGNKPIDRHKMVAFLADRVPAHNVDRLISIMIAAKAIKMVPGGYIPAKLAQEV